MYVYNVETKERFIREDGVVLPLMKCHDAQEVICQDKENIYVRCGNNYGENPWVSCLSKQKHRFFDKKGNEIFFE